MPYARTAEQLESLRAKGILPPRRWPSQGQKAPPTTRGERIEHREGRAVESEQQILAVALAQPHRRAMPSHRIEQGKRVENDKRDPRAGYALGRAFLAGDIDGDELAAARRYTELALRHMQHITGRMPRLPCQAIDDGAKGVGTSADMSDEEVFKLRQSWEDAQRALADTFEWQACVKALYNVGLMDRDPDGEVETRALRMASQALHRMWS